MVNADTSVKMTASNLKEHIQAEINEIFDPVLRGCMKRLITRVQDTESSEALIMSNITCVLREYFFIRTGNPNFSGELEEPVRLVIELAATRLTEENMEVLETRFNEINDKIRKMTK